jgi:branched-chain amino acid aminotransferase
MGINPKKSPVRLAIAVWPWGKYLGEGDSGIRVKISSYTRLHSNIFMTKAKVCGGYVNSILAKCEALDNGYDVAILLDPEGFVAEGPGENIFIIKDGKIKTPPVDNSLCGITRDTIFKIAKGQYEIEEKRFSRDELYIADEAFFTGTAAEIAPIREVDNRQIGIGKPGQITKKIEEQFYNIVNGKDKAFEHFLTYV